MAVQIIMFRGYRMTAVFRDAILAAEHRAGFRFTITQGGFNKGGVLASAGIKSLPPLETDIFGKQRFYVLRHVDHWLAANPADVRAYINRVYAPMKGKR